MVARDGVEPPTPAFSECGYLIHSTTCRSRTAAYLPLSTCKSDLLWVALWVARYYFFHFSLDSLYGVISNTVPWSAMPPLLVVAYRFPVGSRMNPAYG
jgi:hypothetical protein